MKRKIFAVAISVLLAICCAFAFGACGALTPGSQIGPSQSEEPNAPEKEEDKKPEEGGQKPDESEKEPDEGGEEPGGDEKEPGGDEKEPGEGGEEPGGDEKEPGGDEKEPDDGLEYTEYGPRAYAVTGCKSQAAHIDVPATHNGKPVTLIDSHAFENCTNLESIALPASVETVYPPAFNGCTNLASVTVDDGNPYLSDKDGCLYDKEQTKLVYVPQATKGAFTIPDNVTSIGWGAFTECGITSLTIPASVNYVGTDAFDCQNITDVYIADLEAWCGVELQVVELGGAHKFNPCTSPFINVQNLYIDGEKVAELEIPQEVTKLSGYAFYGLGCISSVTIPDTVTEIGECIFAECDGLESITIPFVGLGDWHTEFYYLFGETAAVPKSLKSVTVLGGKISSYAFSNCSGIQNITICGGVTAVGQNAFLGCTGLERVDTTDLAAWCNIDFYGEESNPLYYAHNLYYNGAPVTDLDLTGTTSVGRVAFIGCESIESVTLGSGETDISYKAFDGCTNIKTLTMPAAYVEDFPLDNVQTVNFIGSGNLSTNALYDSESLKAITIGDEITSIGYGVFRNCSNLESVTIGDGLKEIASSAFAYCSSLKRVDVSSLNVWCNINFNDGSNPVSKAHCLYVDGVSLTNLELPQDIGAINSYAFEGLESLESATVDGNVLSIGEYAFIGCTNLESLTIGGNVKTIGNSIIYQCDNLKSLTVPFVEERMYKFWSRTDVSSSKPETLASLTILGGEIPENAFEFCTGVQKIILGDGVTIINRNAFKDCTDIQDLDLGDGVSSLPYTAFSGCTGLKNLTIGKNLAEVGDAFVDCTALERVEVTDLAAWCNIDFYDYTSNPLNIAHNLYYDGAPVTNLVIPQGVETIKKYVFAGCESIESLSLCDVNTVGESAFRNCTGLEKVTFPASVSEVKSSAFDGCTALAGVYTDDLAAWCNIDYTYDGDNPLNLAHTLYYDGAPVTNLVIPQNVDEIKNYAFQGCESIESVKTGATTIGERAFSKCTGINTLTLDVGVEVIGNRAFEYCSGLGEVILPDGVTTVGHGAYMECGNLTKLIIPDSVTNMEDDIVYSCNKLAELKLPYMTKNMRITDLFGVIMDASYIKAPLTSVTVSRGEIGSAAFMNSKTLQEIILGDGVTTIGESAFKDCIGLKRVTMGNGITTVGSGTAGYGTYAYASFRGCTALEYVYINDLNHWCNIDFYSASDNPLYYAHVLCLDGEAVTTLENQIDETEKINDYAFINCTSLLSLIIPDVTYIGYSAFKGCTNVEAATLPFIGQDGQYVNDFATDKNSFNYIFGNPQLGNTEGLPISLKTVAIRGGQTITSYAFNNCGYIQNLDIALEVSTISLGAFHGCSNLVSLTLPSSFGTFEKIFADSTGHGDVPESLKKVTIWDNGAELIYKGLQNCEHIESVTLCNIKTIPNDMFSGCTALKTIDMGTMVNKISYNAFYGCTSLVNVVVCDAVTSIGSSAFYNCTALESVRLGINLKTVNSAAFGNCTSLQTIHYKGSYSGWLGIHKDSSWNVDTGDYVIACTDKSVKKDGTVIS